MLVCEIKPITFYKAVIKEVDVMPAKSRNIKEPPITYLDVSYADRKYIGFSELGTNPMEAFEKLAEKI